MNIDIIVQARMGSKRLPGKVLMPIMGRPMIEYVLGNCLRCSGIRRVAAAFPNHDEAIWRALFESEAYSHGFFGPQEDVAARFINYTETFRPDAFVRICGDSPLIDWRVVNDLIGLFKLGGFDLVSNVGGGFPPGQQAEVIGTSFFLANKDRLDREHVTPTLYGLADPGRKMIAMASWSPPGPSLVVDTQEDFNRVKYVIEQLDGVPWCYSWRQLQIIAREYERTRADQAATADGDVR